MMFNVLNISEYKVLFCDGELHVLEFELFELVFSEIEESILNKIDQFEQVRFL